MSESFAKCKAKTMVIQKSLNIVNVYQKVMDQMYHSSHTNIVISIFQSTSRKCFADSETRSMVIFRGLNKLFCFFQ